ncbi:MAG: glycerophosphodiester phosphodiesterase family protein [bacterium]|nr:glycerophosphodiester phosphodiesterase family protein [bacterium]
MFYFTFMFSFGGYGKKPLILERQFTTDSVFLLAHRGIGEYYPESSEGSLAAAHRIGFRAVEVDVEKTSDKQLIIFHDHDCLRLHGKEGNLDSLTLSYLQSFPLVFNGTESKDYARTPEELVKKYHHKLIFYFDMKVKDLESADQLVAVIKKYGIEKYSILANSHFPLIWYVEMKYPEITTALEGFDKGKEWTYYLMPKDLKPDFLSSFAATVDSAHVAWLKENDLLSRRIVYGVNGKTIDSVLN